MAASLSHSTLSKLIFNQATDSLVAVNTSAEIILANVSFCRIFGVDEASVNGQYIDDIVLCSANINIQEILDDFINQESYNEQIGRAHV